MAYAVLSGGSSRSAYSPPARSSYSSYTPSRPSYTPYTPPKPSYTPSYSPPKPSPPIISRPPATVQPSFSTYNSQMKKVTTTSPSPKIDVKIAWDAPISSPSNIAGTVLGATNTGIYTYKKVTDNFNVTRNGDVATIQGARSQSALSEGIKGTRYTTTNMESNGNVWKFVDAGTAVKDSLSIKTLGAKVGYAGIAYDTISDLPKDYAKGGATRAAAGVVVNVSTGVTSMVSGAYAGALVGSAVPGIGTAVGAFAGLVAGGLVAVATETKINGKSIKEHAKDGVEWTINKIGEGVNAIASGASKAANEVKNFFGRLF